MKVLLQYLMVVFSFVLVVPFSATAMSPLEELFQNDAVVASSLIDISKMGREEIESIITFHTACSVIVQSEVDKSSCKKEQSIFEMKYSRKRSIDTIMYACVTFRNYFELSSQKPILDPDKKEASDKLVKRYVYVTRVVSEAITKRYQTLAKIR